jgi:hypothetical protein
MCRKQVPWSLEDWKLFGLVLSMEECMLQTPFSKAMARHATRSIILRVNRSFNYKGYAWGPDSYFHASANFNQTSRLFIIHLLIYTALQLLWICYRSTFLALPLVWICLPLRNELLELLSKIIDVERVLLNDCGRRMRW